MTNVNDRLAEILAEYAGTIAEIERPAASTEPGTGRLLRPADQQRACRTPTIGPTA
ncbi:MAG TPA: hypothetical protein VH496_07440 [Mycobacterium sp.]|jgi:hypothetical protein